LKKVSYIFIGPTLNVSWEAPDPGWLVSDKKAKCGQPDHFEEKNMLTTISDDFKANLSLSINIFTSSRAIPQSRTGKPFSPWRKNYYYSMFSW